MNTSGMENYYILFAVIGSVLLVSTQIAIVVQGVM